MPPVQQKRSAQIDRGSPACQYLIHTSCGLLPVRGWRPMILSTREGRTEESKPRWMAPSSVC
jgi:hypothetical protein